MAQRRSCVADIDEGEHFDLVGAVGGLTPFDIVQSSAFEDTQKQVTALEQHGDSFFERKKEQSDEQLDGTPQLSGIEAGGIFKGTKIKQHVSVVAPIADNGSANSIAASGCNAEASLQSQLSCGESGTDNGLANNVVSWSCAEAHPISLVSYSVNDSMPAVFDSVNGSKSSTPASRSSAEKQGFAASTIPVPAQDPQGDDRMSTGEAEASRSASEVALQEKASSTRSKLVHSVQVEPAHAEYLDAQQRRNGAFQQQPRASDQLPASQRQHHLPHPQPRVFRAQHDWLDVERELGFRVRDENGEVDLAFAREVRRRNISCLACWENPPQVTIKECGHTVLCGRCFLDPDFVPYQGMPCLRCGKPSVGLKFSPELLRILIRRSQPK